MRLPSLQTACRLSACRLHVGPQHLQTRPSTRVPTVPKCPLFPLVVRGRDALPLLVSTGPANHAELPRPWAKGSSKATSTASIEKTGRNSIVPSGHTHSFYRRLDCRALLLRRHSIIPATACDFSPSDSVHHHQLSTRKIEPKSNKIASATVSPTQNCIAPYRSSIIPVAQPVPVVVTNTTTERP